MHHPNTSYTSQGLNDAATLKNKKKNLAIGLCFIDPCLKQNVALTLGMVTVKGGTDKIIGEKVAEVTKRVTGYDYKEIAHSTMVDYAGIGVANEFDHEPEGCAMHLDDKCVAVCAGSPLRSVIFECQSRFGDSEVARWVRFLRIKRLWMLCF